MRGGKGIDARLSKANRIAGIMNHQLSAKGKTAVKDNEIYILRNLNKTDGIIWIRNMSFEPGNEGKEATSKNIRGKKTENEYITRILPKADRLDNKCKKVRVAGSHEESYRR